MIELKNIIKTYADDVHALRGINLRIERGTIYGIVGLSGAGKSTLIRCINLLERPTSGEVIIDGHDLTAMSESELREERRHIGMIFQHFNLLSSATVYDNVAFPLRLAGRSAEEIRPKVTELLALVGLADKAISRAGRNSASASRARSRAIQRCCCATRRPPRSTHRQRSPSSRSSATSTGGSV